MIMLQGRIFNVEEIILSQLVEDWFNDGKTDIALQEELIYLFNEYNMELPDDLADLASQLYAHLERNNGHYKVDEFPFVVKLKDGNPHS